MARSILKRSNSDGAKPSSSGQHGSNHRKQLEWAPGNSLNLIREIPCKEEIRKDVAAEEMEQRRREISERREKLRTELAVAKVRQLPLRRHARSCRAQTLQFSHTLCLFRTTTLLCQGVTSASSPARTRPTVSGEARHVPRSSAHAHNSHQTLAHRFSSLAQVLKLRGWPLPMPLAPRPPPHAFFPCLQPTRSVPATTLRKAATRRTRP